jgi:hypothetical protein
MIHKGTVKRGLMIAMLAASAPSLSHHSFAMFDAEQVVTLHGTVKEIQWTNPHCFLQVFVPAPQGFAEWSIEMHSPSVSRRMHWSRDTLRPGEQVTVSIHPARAGAPGGFLISAIGTDGRTHSYGTAP